MYSDLITIGGLAVYLPFVFLLHSASYRVNPSLRESPAQGPAFKVVAAGALIFLALLAVILPFDGEWVSHLIFAVLGLACLGTFYFTFICVSESGRRYFLLTLLERSNRPLTREELAALYGKDYMIDVRLERLVTWGVVEENKGRLLLRKKSFFLYSSFFHAWARVLGYQWFERQRQP
jgi:hypothetical protein